MTPAQIWLIEPVIILAVLGLALILGSLFRHPLARLLDWSDRQSTLVWGGIVLALAGFLALFLWIIWPP